MSEKVKGPWKQVAVLPDESLQDAMNELERTHAVTSVVWTGALFHVLGKEKQAWRLAKKGE